MREKILNRRRYRANTPTEGRIKETRSDVNKEVDRVEIMADDKTDATNQMTDTQP